MSGLGFLRPSWRVLALAGLVLLVGVPQVFATTDTIGGTTLSSNGGPGYMVAAPVAVSAGGSVQSLGIDWAGTQGGSVTLGLYSNAGGKPGSLLTQTASTAMSTTTGWQDISVTSSYPVTVGTTYWIAFMFSSTKTYYYSTGSRSYYAKAYGAFDSAWSSSSTQDSAATANLRITYSSGPPPSDFTVSASPTSQSVGAGATATYALSIQYGSSLSATVDLGVTSGCPTGVTCTFSPPSVTGSSTVTLSVPTLPTTPGGTTTITVTATSTSPALSHTVQVQLTVNPPGSYPVYVYAGASKVTVTVTWSGSGTAAIYLAGPGGSPTLSESGAVIYDRVVYVSGSSTPTYIHRVTFTLSSPPTSTQTWNALVALTGSYTVTIEVNSPSPTT